MMLPPQASSPGSRDSKNVLPQDPLFTRLLILAARIHSNTNIGFNSFPVKPAIVDLNTGISATLPQLLSDTIHLRDHIRSQLTTSTLQSLENSSSQNDNEVYVHLLASGGYDFAVGVLAILALGAAVSPLSAAQPVHELSYYVRKTRAVAIVTGREMEKIGEKLVGVVCSSSSSVEGRSVSDFAHIPVSSGLSPGRSFIAPNTIVIDSYGYRDLNRPGLVIFTSGTTGPPKAAVLPRASITDGAWGFAQQLGLNPDHTLLHLLPVHHATGMWINFFPFLQAGATIEFRPGSFDPQWTWDRWRRGGLTHFSGVPTIYMRLKRHFEEVIEKLEHNEIKAYESAARAFAVMMCGTSALPRPIDEFWTRIRHGRKIVQRYGSTELGAVFNMPFENNEDVPDGSVGEVTIGVDMKLSTEPGREGEILCRSYKMFSKYLHDPEATRAAFDKQGYFQSGDIARQEGKYYFIVGRASVDIIKSGGYKISALDIEREILALPYIGECMVVGVPDEEFGQRVGCVVTVRDNESARKFLDGQGRQKQKGSVALNDLRADVRDRLAGYKLPTLLRVISTDIPKSATGKVVKKTLGPMYFPADYDKDPDVQVWRSSRKERQQHQPVRSKL